MDVAVTLKRLRFKSTFVIYFSYGADNIVCYGIQFKPLEWEVNENKSDDCYAKLVVHKNNPVMPNKIIGFHYLGLEAGEVTQGFAVAVKKGVTKEDMDLSIGIHPTCAEAHYL
jgi:pyruvate/2-oxoglutarate dehydrogenase complex dihydrolipoamide dehydrogenase (E3) component